MLTINSSDVIKKPSYITKPKEITLVKDAKQHIARSVVIPYKLYEKLKDKIEDELYLMNNQDALSKEAYKEFMDIEAVAEELGK
jgi:hypothetical protein